MLEPSLLLEGSSISNYYEMVLEHSYYYYEYRWRLEPHSIFLLLLDGGSSLQPRDLTFIIIEEARASEFFIIMVKWRLEPQSILLLLLLDGGSSLQHRRYYF